MLVGYSETKNYYLTLKFPCGCEISLTYFKSYISSISSYEEDVHFDSVNLCNDCRVALSQQMSDDDILDLLTDFAYDIIDDLETRIEDVEIVKFKHPLKDYLTKDIDLEYETV